MLMGWSRQLDQLANTVIEATKILPFLTDPGRHGGDPADAFDLVVPSLPGFSFSDHATERGMDVQRVAGLWNTLMPPTCMAFTSPR